MPPHPANPGDEPDCVRDPHRTLFALTLPVLVSLVAEPLTGLVDTAFVSRLGAPGLAALGIATTLISTVFWVFNFLGIGTQTEVARAHGEGRPDAARKACSLAMAMGLALGTALCLIGWPLAEPLAALMGAGEEARAGTVIYMRIRLLGGPAVLLTIAVFGALRGLQDMRTPLVIAIVTNLVNVVLDALLIFGAGPIPRLELAGAAWASTAAQWLAAVWATLVVARRLGLAPRLELAEAQRLMVVGRDLFLRTAALLFFSALATRAANRIGTESGAAHQVIRQVWVLTALLLDAWAIAAQSLIGYFLAAARTSLARRVATIACLWGLASGAVLCGLMLLGADLVMRALVPESAWTVFLIAWIVSALAQPLNALSFVTDGIHWGTRDYRYLRNVMFVATGLGAALLLSFDGAAVATLTNVWWVTGGWIALRAGFGVARIWPGLGESPLRNPSS